MKYDLSIILGLLSMTSPLSAQDILPGAQQRLFEVGLHLVHQEGTGVRMQAAYVANLGVPALTAKFGLSLGVLQFRDVRIPDYGFFMESAFPVRSAYSCYIKTAVHTLDFPAAKANEDSLATLEFETGLHFPQDSWNWSLGVGARYQSLRRVLVADGAMEKTWLVYPSLGVGWLF